MGRVFESRFPIQKPVRRFERFKQFKRHVLIAHVAQLAEHILGKDEVTSSILVMGSIAWVVNAVV